MIPEGWDQVTLADVATVRRGAGSQYLTYVDGPEHGIRLIRIGDFLADDRVYVERTRHIDRFLLSKGDILIAGTGATAGIIFEIPDDFDGLAFSYNAPLIQVSPSVSKKYIFLVLSSQIVIQQQNALFTGNAQPFLDTKAISGFKFPLPSLPEQRQIAEILSTWGRAIETLEALIANACTQKTALMQCLLTGKKRLPGFSGAWATVKLGSLCQISKGEQLGRLAMIEEGAIPVINGGISASGYTDKANTAGGCITISEGGNSCGFVSMIDQPFWCGGHCYALKDLTADRSFLFAALKHRQTEIMTLRVGSGLPNIQKKALSGFALLVPPRPEQEAIGHCADIQDREINALEAQLAALRQEKSALMQQLLTGKRRVKVVAHTDV